MGPARVAVESDRQRFPWKVTERLLTYGAWRALWVVAHNTERVAKSMKTSSRRSDLDRIWFRPPASRRDTETTVTTGVSGHAQYYWGLFFALRVRPLHRALPRRSADRDRLRRGTADEPNVRPLDLSGALPFAGADLGRRLKILSTNSPQTPTYGRSGPHTPAHTRRPRPQRFRW